MSDYVCSSTGHSYVLLHERRFSRPCSISRVFLSISYGASDDYTIVPADQYPNYAVADYKPNTGLSLWDCISDPITAITTIGSKALSVVLYLLPKVIWVAVGAALVIGFCAFTPYCTLTLEKPFSHELKSLGNSCLDYAEDLYRKAYEKFNEI